MSDGPLSQSEVDVIVAEHHSRDELDVDVKVDLGPDSPDASPEWARLILDRLNGLAGQLDRMERHMTSSQSHLDADVSGLKAGFAALVAEWKTQHAKGEPIDFSSADELLSDVNTEVGNEQTADAPAPAAPTDGTDGVPVATTPADGGPQTDGSASAEDAPSPSV